MKKLTALMIILAAGITVIMIPACNDAAEPKPFEKIELNQMEVDASIDHPRADVREFLVAVKNGIVEDAPPGCWITEEQNGEIFESCLWCITGSGGGGPISPPPFELVECWDGDGMY